MNRLVLGSWVLLVVLFSCKGNEDPVWMNDLDKISQLNCQAIQLREARFALADSMRFYQDSLLDLGGTMADRKEYWQSSLEIMELRKTQLANKSRNLSDTIREELLRLTRDLTVDEKRIFNDSIQVRTEGCEGKD